MKILATLFCFTCLFWIDNNDEEIIVSKLMHQVKCWNQGDFDCFLKDYWKNDSLVFVGKSGVTYGWNNVLENYKTNYPTQNEMGKLNFEIVKLDRLGDNHFLLIGKWKITRTGESLAGHFSVVWKKINGDWVIIADHSS